MSEPVCVLSLNFVLLFLSLFFIFLCLFLYFWNKERLINHKESSFEFILFINFDYIFSASFQLLFLLILFFQFFVVFSNIYVKLIFFIFSLSFLISKEIKVHLMSSFYCAHRVLVWSILFSMTSSSAIFYWFSLWSMGYLRVLISSELKFVTILLFSYNFIGFWSEDSAL